MVLICLWLFWGWHELICREFLDWYPAHCRYYASAYDFITLLFKILYVLAPWYPSKCVSPAFFLSYTNCIFPPFPSVPIKLLLQSPAQAPLPRLLSLIFQLKVVLPCTTTFIWAILWHLKLPILYSIIDVHMHIFFYLGVGSTLRTEYFIFKSLAESRCPPSTF